MDKFLLSFVFTLMMGFALTGQTVILDFETPETSTQFQYFGSTIDGTLNNVIDNFKSC